MVEHTVPAPLHHLSIRSYMFSFLGDDQSSAVWPLGSNSRLQHEVKGGGYLVSVVISAIP